LNRNKGDKMIRYKDNFVHIFYVKTKFLIALILFILFLNACATKTSTPPCKTYHSEFSGLHHLLFLNCRTIPSIANSGIFSASGLYTDMVALAMGEAFRHVPHIRMSYFPFSAKELQKKIMSQSTQYDGIVTGKAWWQLNVDQEAKNSIYEFDLMVQLDLHKKSENNTITTRHFYFPVIKRKGVIIKNQLFFCEKNDEPLELAFQKTVIPELSMKILALTYNTREIAVKKPPTFFDLKSKILFQSKAYYALIQHIIETRLSQNNQDVASLLFNARFNDAIEKMNESKYSREIFTLNKYARQYHTGLYTLGLCFEKTGRFKKALSCYRFVMKYAPDKSRLCADGIGRCLKTMGITDHIQWSNLKVHSEPAFILAMQKKEKKMLDKPVQELKTKVQLKPIIEDKTIIEPAAYPVKIDREDDRIDIQIMIDQWLSAWRSMKPDEYFNYYASSFEPDKNVSLAKWKKKRRKRLQRKSIFVSIVGEIDIIFESDDEATVLFIQDFESKGYYYKDRTKKRLKVIKVDDNFWKIQKEQVLEILL